MPSSFISKEELPANVQDDEVKEMIRLRIKAGAIRCWREGNQLFTEWSVIGEQD